MQSIYQKAASVFIWLGPDHDRCASTLRRLDETGRKICDEPELFKWEIRFWLGKFSAIHWPSGGTGPDDKHLEQLLHENYVSNAVGAEIPYDETLKLLQRSWWQRVWVLQEVVLPGIECKDRHDRMHQIVFACGSARCCLYRLAPVLTLFRLHELARYGVLHDTEDTASVPMHDQRPFLMLSARVWFSKAPLLTLLRASSEYTNGFRRLCASDPRDRIYALLGVASDVKKLGIVPDYTKNCRDVYTDTAARMVKFHTAVIVLLSQFPKQMPNLPSWVPDWSAESRGYFIRTPESVYEHGFDKLLAKVKPDYDVWPNGKGMEHDIQVNAKSGVLRLKGVVLDSIAQLVLNEKWNDFLKDAARFGFRSKYQGMNTVHFSKMFKKPASEKEAEAACASYRRLKNKELTFFSPLEGKDVDEDLVEQTRASNLEAMNDLRDSAKIKPYMSLENLDTKDVRPALSCIAAIYTHLRSMCHWQKSVLKQADLENAIWRTLIADQSFAGDSNWIRPSSDVRSAILCFDSLSGEKPVGFANLASEAWMERVHHILSMSGMFEDDTLTLEDVKHLPWSRKDQLGIGVLMDEGQICMEVMRQKNDGNLHRGGRFKKLPELATILYELGALTDTHFQEAETVRRGLVNGSISWKTITDAAYAETRKALDLTLRQTMGLYSGVRHYLQLASTQAIGRKLFVTGQGLPGLGPQHMQVGDVIVAWAGVPSFVVMRPIGNGRHSYVGEAYIHGAMDGELTSSMTATIVTFEVE